MTVKISVSANYEGSDPTTPRELPPDTPCPTCGKEILKHTKEELRACVDLARTAALKKP
jgi:uncharacterized protein with PIN domain